MKKICLLIGGGMLVVGFIFILFLPLLLSSALVLEKTLTHVNQQSRGSFYVGDCSIGWFQGLVCNQIEYKCIDNGLIFNIEQLRGDRGLLALVAVPNNLGIIHLYQPVIEWDAQPDDFNWLGEQNKKNNEREWQFKSGAEEAPFWEKYIVRLVVEDGRFVFGSSELPVAVNTPLMVDFSLVASLSSGTVRYDLQCLLNEDDGIINIQGVINLPARKETFFETIVARNEVRFEQLQLAPLLALVPPGVDIPFDSGLVTGFFTVGSSGLKQLDLFGSMDIKDLSLQKGWAGDGSPGFDWFNVQFDGGVSNGDNWFCNELTVESEFGKLTARGELSFGIREVDLTASLQMTGSQTFGAKIDLRAGGFFTPSRVIVRDLEVQLRDFIFVADGELPIEQSELFIRSVQPEIDENIPVIIQELEIAASMEGWQRAGGGLSGYDWQKQLLFVNNLKMSGELHGQSVFVRLHPLFGVLTTATGRLELWLDELYWPLSVEGENEAFFTTILDVSRVNFESRGVLAEVFAPLEISEKSLKLEENEIFCRGAAGRITCSPVAIVIPGSELIINGSVGLDQSLDYLLSIALSKEQFGGLEVSLQGTLTKPVFYRIQD